MEIIKSGNNFIDLENGRLIFDNHEIYVITDDDNITWFKGKDICNVLNLKDSKDVMKSYIPGKNKIYYDKIKGGSQTPPFKIHPQTIFIDEAGLYILLIKSKMPKTKEFKQFLDINLPILKNNLKLKNYNKIDNFKNIFDFINSQNYNIKLGNWFKDIWFPLYKQEEVLITDDILYFVRYGYDEITGGTAVPPGNISEIKRNLVKILKKYKIPYKEIKHDNLEEIEKYQYIQEEIKKLSPNNLVQKTWIVLEVRQFKSLIARLDTEVAQEIREYLITLEEILFDYMKYTKDYEIKRSEYEKLEKENKLLEASASLIEQENKMLELKSDFSNQLSIKDKELSLKDKELSLKDEEIKENKDKVLELKTKVDRLSENQLKFKKLLSNIKTHQTKGYIYIATTKEYAKNTIFKIGNTENLRKRQSNYQTGRSSLDSFYFCYYRETYYPKSIDKYIQLVLKEFKDKKNSEMYIIHFVKLKKLIDVIVDNYNKSFEEINKFIENELEESYDLDVFIPEPILL